MLLIGRGKTKRYPGAGRRGVRRCPAGASSSRFWASYRRALALMRTAFASRSAAA